MLQGRHDICWASPSAVPSHPYWADPAAASQPFAHQEPGHPLPDGPQL